MHLPPSVPFAGPFLFFPFQSEDEDTPHTLAASSPVLVPRQSAPPPYPAEETRKTRRNSRAPTASVECARCERLQLALFIYILVLFTNSTSDKPNQAGGLGLVLVLILGINALPYIHPFF
jgi:hypothetical protein